MNTHPNIIDPLIALRARVVGIVTDIDSLIAAQRGPVAVDPVEEETDNHLDYRLKKNPNAQLSKLGERVVTRLIENGLTDEQIGARMGISVLGVHRFRRRHAMG